MIRMSSVKVAQKVPASGLGTMSAASVELRQEAARGGRATGAVFFAFFGAAWLIWGYYLGPWHSSLPVILMIIIALLLAAAALRVARRNRDAMVALRGTVEHRRMRRRFLVTNVVQWVAIAIAANVLGTLGLGQWIALAIMVIVGLHFLPLAYTFQHYPHYLTGVALLATALISSVAGHGASGSADACFAAGGILWLSALSSLRATPKSKS